MTRAGRYLVHWIHRFLSIVRIRLEINCASDSPFLLRVYFGRVTSLVNLWTHSLLHRFSVVKRVDHRSSWESVLLLSHLLHGFLVISFSVSIVYPGGAHLSIRKTAKEKMKNSGRIPLEMTGGFVLYL